MGTKVEKRQDNTKEKWQNCNVEIAFSNNSLRNLPFFTLFCHFLCINCEKLCLDFIEKRFSFNIVETDQNQEKTVVPKKPLWSVKHKDSYSQLREQLIQIRVQLSRCWE